MPAELNCLYYTYYLKEGWSTQRIFLCAKIYIWVKPNFVFCCCIVRWFRSTPGFWCVEGAAQLKSRLKLCGSLVSYKAEWWHGSLWYTMVIRKWYLGREEEICTCRCTLGFSSWNQRGWLSLTQAMFLTYP